MVPLQSDQELLTLAQTVWGEARSEGTTGMAAVCHVIINRTNSRRFPNTVTGVVMQPYQFSMWNTNDPNRVRALTTPLRNESMLQALNIVTGCLTGTIADPTNGATHYHTRSVNPSWNTALTRTAVIGEHIFYRE